MSRSVEYAVLVLFLVVLWAFAINPLVHMTVDAMDASANRIAEASHGR